MRLGGSTQVKDTAWFIAGGANVRAVKHAARQLVGPATSANGDRLRLGVEDDRIGPAKPRSDAPRGVLV